jgi:hypothetical protein
MGGGCDAAVLGGGRMTCPYLKAAFEHAEKHHTDVMEPYSTRLADADSDSERMEIMRAGLRKTVSVRYPLKVRESLGAPA